MLWSRRRDHSYSCARCWRECHTGCRYFPRSSRRHSRSLRYHYPGFDRWRCMDERGRTSSEYRVSTGHGDINNRYGQLRWWRFHEQQEFSRNLCAPPAWLRYCAGNWNLWCRDARWGHAPAQHGLDFRPATIRFCDGCSRWYRRRSCSPRPSGAQSSAWKHLERGWNRAPSTDSGYHCSCDRRQCARRLWR